MAAVLGGSGFLAIYLAGIILGNSSIVFRNGIFLFHDAGAWLGQIVLFIMLGLLSFPSRLLGVSAEGLMIALVLIFVARPLADMISVFPFRFRLRELVFLGWVGLKGAVPITLATFPLLAGVEDSHLLFNVVFFVVLVSAVTQGWSLPLVARWLKLGKTSDPISPVTVEINALRHVDGEIVEYVVTPSSKVAGQALRDMALPYDVVVTLVVRRDDVIIPRGSTPLEPGDHVFIAMRHANGLMMLNEELIKLLGDAAYKKLSPRHHLPKGSADKEIARLAKELRADVVVMGTLARADIAGFIIGNTAETILDQLTCSVLAIKPPGFVSPVQLDDY